MKHILVINSGSSSIKFKIIALPSAHTLLEGSVEGIGDELCEHHLHIHIKEDDHIDVDCQHRCCPDHQAAFESVVRDLEAALYKHKHLRIDAIGHRVVHGGERFIDPVQINFAVVDDIAALSPLAPQHLPSNVLGMQLCLRLFPDIIQVAVFDTAFHHSLPEHIYRYAIPEKWFREYGIRRFGFHGSSHQYVSQQAAMQLNKPLSSINLISLHLGNGDSACAIQQGKSIDTSMGFTPLEGLMIGNRCGDLDASVPMYLHETYDLSAEQINHELNFDSGLQAICDTHDMHQILARAQSGDSQAELALKMFIYHVRKYIGAYLVMLNQVDAIIFTGGIGEHAAEIRARCCEDLAPFGIVIDEIKNANATCHEVTDIATSTSPVRILLIPTNEELEIAKAVNDTLNIH
jgi:acetate kinase